MYKRQALNLPVLAVVAAIGLAVAAGILIYKNWDKIKAKAVELGAKIDVYKRQRLPFPT